MNKSLYVGLMSGTSIDAIDSVIVRCKGNTLSIVSSLEHPIPAGTRQRIARLSHSGPDEIEQMGILDRELGQLFAEATGALLLQAGISATDISAIGSHGQTIRHRPRSGGHSRDKSFTLQIGDPNTIAELTGITTVADFRRRDIAAGGEGAPLVPAFHRAAFGTPGINRAIVNIGGIANVSILAGCELQLGCDTGPGNTLMDHWIERHTQQRFDDGGAWAAQGAVDQGLLTKLLEHPYLRLTGPRSTGKEDFNLNWLSRCAPEVEAQDARCVQATLSEFTATTISNAVANCGLKVAEVYICGGGAHNLDLMARLQRHLAPAKLTTTAALEMDPDWVEAAAFGWLAHQTIAGKAGNAPLATGAAGSRILGGIFPA